MNLNGISQQKKPRGSFIVLETSNGNSNYHHGDATILRKTCAQKKYLKEEKEDPSNFKDKRF
jgi:hypothetical protein